MKKKKSSLVGAAAPNLKVEIADDGPVDYKQLRDRTDMARPLTPPRALLSNTI